MSIPLDRPTPRRYIVSLDAALQEKIFARGRDADEFLHLLDGSDLFAAVHLQAGPAAGDPLLRAAALTARLPRTGLFAEIDIARKHPVNVARSLLSLSHLSGHKAGWGLRPAADAALLAQNPWIKQEPAAAHGSIRWEFATLVTALTRSWPYESLIGDRPRGWFYVDGAIRPIHHQGRFDVEGVLNIPSAPHGAVPFLTFDADRELAGHLRVQAPAGRDVITEAAGVTLRPVEAPSNAAVGRSSDKPALYLVEGVGTADQLRLLKRHADLDRPDDAVAPADASIWHLLGVRPSVAAIDFAPQS